MQPVLNHCLCLSGDANNRWTVKLMKYIRITQLLFRYCYCGTVDTGCQIESMKSTVFAQLFGITKVDTEMVLFDTNCRKWYGAMPYWHRHPSFSIDPIYLWCSPFPWWRHQMETFSELLAICAENSPVTGEFPEQMPVTRSFDVFFDLRLSKQSWGWWFETPSRPLWRHCNVKPVQVCITIRISSGMNRKL